MCARFILPGETHRLYGRPDARHYGRVEQTHFDGARFRRDIVEKAFLSFTEFQIIF